MALYDSGVAAYRDTTKWLTAFVPLGSLAAATATIGPDLVWSVKHANGIGDWLTHHWIAAVCLVIVLAGIVAILYWGGKVLSIAPTDLGKVQSPEFAPRLATAIGQGVTAPEFLTIDQFNAAMAALANSWDQPAPAPGDELTLTRVKAAVESLRQWAVFDRVQGAFRVFIGVFALATAAIGAGVVIAPSQLGSGPRIDKPTAVTVRVDPAGQAELTNATGCTDPAATTFLAIDGSWLQPTLAVDGPGCRFAATWTPDPDRVEIRPAP